MVRLGQCLSAKYELVKNIFNLMSNYYIFEATETLQAHVTDLCLSNSQSSDFYISLRNDETYMSLMSRWV